MSVGLGKMTAEPSIGDDSVALDLLLLLIPP